MLSCVSFMCSCLNFICLNHGFCLAWNIKLAFWCCKYEFLHISSLHWLDLLSKSLFLHNGVSVWLLIYSTVRKRHKENPDQVNGDYFLCPPIRPFWETEIYRTEELRPSCFSTRQKTSQIDNFHQRTEAPVCWSKCTIG